MADRKVHPSANPHPPSPANRTEQLEALLEVAAEVWTPCDTDPRWCTAHSETPPCPVATLGYVLTDLDGFKRPQPWDADDVCDTCWHPESKHMAVGETCEMGVRCDVCGHRK